MKTLIAYATKTGTTRKAAEALADALRAKGGEVVLHDLATDTSMPDADAIIVGGSVRFGQWDKRSLQYVKNNEHKLFHKTYALFACRCGKDNTRALLEPQIGETLSNDAIAVVNLGGEMDIHKQKGMDRLVVKMLGKKLDETMSSTGVLTDAVNDLADQVWNALPNA